MRAGVGGEGAATLGIGEGRCGVWAAARRFAALLGCSGVFDSDAALSAVNGEAIGCCADGASAAMRSAHALGDDRASSLAVLDGPPPGVSGAAAATRFAGDMTTK